MLLLVGGCTATRPDGRPTGAPSSGPSSSPTPPAVGLDVFAAAGIRATRVAPGLAADRYFALHDTAADVVVAGTTMVANSMDRGSRAYRVITSTDLGRTWREIALPGAPADDGWAILSRTGSVVVAVGGGNTHSVWLTGDGIAWRGGPVPVEPDGYVLARPLQQVDGAVVVARQDKGVARIVRTADGGVTWQTVGCPAMFRPTGDPGRCETVTPAGGNLWVRWTELSLDGGKTWRRVSIVPDPQSTIMPMLEETVVLPTGGWLSPVWVTFGAGTATARLLVRSLDGVTWEPVIPFPCDKAGGEGAAVSRPQAIGNRWLVAYTCDDRADDAKRSFLYLVERDGTGAKMLAAIDGPGRWFGAPVTVGTTVVVPEIRRSGPGDAPTVTFLHLEV